MNILKIKQLKWSVSTQVRRMNRKKVKQELLIWKRFIIDQQGGHRLYISEKILQAINYMNG